MYRSFCVPIGWEWPVEGNGKGRGEHIVDVFKCCRHCGSEFICLRENIGVEKHFPCNTHCHMGHLMPDVNHFSIFPNPLYLITVMYHSTSIACNMSRLKGRSH